MDPSVPHSDPAPGPGQPPGPDAPDAEPSSPLDVPGEAADGAVTGEPGERPEAPDGASDHAPDLAPDGASDHAPDLAPDGAPDHEPGQDPDQAPDGAVDADDAVGDDTTPGPGRAAPAVVAVIVTHDPGAWFDEALDALVAQDYPALAVLVIDTASAEDPMARVTERVPGAVVRRVDTNVGFGPACNEALRLVQGAAFYLFCHDDVALAPGSVRLLVEEAFRSNAGIVGPKLVAWDDPRRLLAVGMAIDKAGEPAPYAEPGELDQEQHDAVRDVFYVPSAVTLVRADLFDALEGYDPDIASQGEDLDLCWRAHCAGARVMVAPLAGARHLALGRLRPGDPAPGVLAARHRLRAVMSCYGPLHALRVLPQVAVATVVAAVAAIIGGRTSHARALTGAWLWNLRRPAQVWRRRRRLHRIRQVPDDEVRNLQVRGSAPLSAFLRGPVDGEDRLNAMASTGRRLVASLRAGPRRLSAAVWLAALLILTVGSRHLVTQRVPAAGQFLAFPADVSDLWRDYLGGLRLNGLGGAAPAPTGVALLALLGAAVGGASGLARTVLVLGPLLVGAIGAWRLARPTGSAAARAVAVAVYLAVPLPYNALAAGRLAPLVAYAAMPFLLARMAQGSRLAPFGPAQGAAGPGTPRRRWHVEVVGLGLVLAVAAAFVPLMAPAVVGVAVVWCLAAVLTGGLVGALRAVGVTLGAVAVAFVLHLPWSADLVGPGWSWGAVAGVERAGPQGLGLGRLVRFQVGPIGAGPLGWAVLAAATLALIIGRGWRWAWATRAWVMAVASFGLAWAADRGLVDVALPDAATLLVPAAAGLALAAACGMAAFEEDLRGFHFGWRQLVSVGLLACVGVAAAPIAGEALDGRWNIPSSDFSRSMSFLAAEPEAPFERLLWLGDPEVMPVPGWQLAPGLAYGLSDGGYPDLRALWPGTPSPAVERVRAALAVAAAGRTSRLGRLLGPFGIRYVVVVQRRAPAALTDTEVPVPGTLLATLASQLDLERVPVDDALVVYRNTAWVPVRAVLSAGAEAAAAADDPAQAIAVDPAGSTPVLAGTAPGPFEGTVGAGTAYAAYEAGDGWSLRVDGRGIPAGGAFGWASRWEVPAGEATLRFEAPTSHRLAVAGQAVAWVAALGVLRRAVVRAKRDAGVESRRQRRRRRRAERAARRAPAGGQGPVAVLVDVGAPAPAPLSGAPDGGTEGP